MATAEELSQFFEQLTGLVHTHSGQEPELAVRDEILAYGERFSSLIVSAYLNLTAGTVTLLDARSLIVSDAKFGEARPLVQESLNQLETNLYPLLVAGSMILTQGFCAATRDGRTTTLGRGGSDFSATWLAARLNASRVEILTDTNGVLSADPAVVAEAHTLTRLSYSQAAILARFGAKVLHPHCLAPPAAGGIPLWVCNSFGPEGPITRVGDEPALADHFSVSGLRDCNLVAYGMGAQPPGDLHDRALAVERDEQGRIWFALGPHGGESDPHGSDCFSCCGRPVALIYLLSPDSQDLVFDEDLEIIMHFKDYAHGGRILAVPREQRLQAIRALHDQLQSRCPVPAGVSA